MQIIVTGRHVDITGAIREYAEGRINAALEPFPRIESVHVILSVEKYRHRAEVVVQGANHIRVDAHDESSDMYASIDNAAEKAAKQLRKMRDRVHDHKGAEPLAEAEVKAAKKEG